MMQTLFIVVMGVMALTSNARIQLRDGGYKNVVISIRNTPTLTRGEREFLLQRIQTSFTEGSRRLFEATKHRVYFKEIIILVPDDWSQEPNDVDRVGNQIKVHVIVQSSSSPSAHAPYVLPYGGCGVQGLYMHLTPGYIMDDSIARPYGNRANVIVHEWAHLRWGIADEYPNGNDPHFYLHNGTWKPTQCTESLSGKLLRDSPLDCVFNKETGKSPNCVFQPDRPNTNVASIMFAQYFENITEFCDDPKTSPAHLAHNRLAPNRQNSRCNYKSAWEVMRQHPDFQNFDTSELPNDTNTTPTFIISRPGPPKIVFVLDVSGSMHGQPLVNLVQDAKRFILYYVNGGTELGIVIFSNSATISTHLIKVDTEEDRNRLVNYLPTSAFGETRIGDGLLKGLQVLNGSCGSIFLLTDGKENLAPYIDDVSIPACVTVNTVAYGSSADQKLADLASKTGGLTFFYSARQNSTGLMDAFGAIVSSQNMPTSSDVPQQISTVIGQASINSPMTGAFLMDSTLGKNTSLIFGFKGKITVNVEGPGGTYFGDPDKDCHDSTCLSEDKLYRMALPGIAEPGIWNYTVTTNDNTSTIISLIIQSRPQHKGDAVLQVTSWTQEAKNVTFGPKLMVAVYALVLKGSAPVLGASVVATVERPDTEITAAIDLLDLGVGADLEKDDGIYSAYVLPSQLDGDGRYNIKVQVTGVKGQSRSVVGATGSSSIAEPYKYPGLPTGQETQDVGLFQRVTTAGEFRVHGYYSNAPDEIPPARITDLRLTSIDSDTLEASMAWTAVGDEMERGTASNYTIFLANDLDQLVSNASTASRLPAHQVVSGSLTQPKPSGDSEQVTIRLTSLDASQTVFVGIVAMDTAGNQGEVSNVVTLTRAEGVSVPIYNNGRVAMPCIHVYAILAMFYAVIIYLD